MKPLIDAMEKMHQEMRSIMGLSAEKEAIPKILPGSIADALHELYPDGIVKDICQGIVGPLGVTFNWAIPIEDSGGLYKKGSKTLRENFLLPIKEVKENSLLCVCGSDEVWLIASVFKGFTIMK